MINKNIKIEPFSITKTDGKTIRGYEYLPGNGENPSTVIIIAHGFGGDMSKTRPYAKALCEDGQRCFIFDFCGGGPDSTSDGSFEDYMTPLTEVDDLETVIAYVRKQPGIEKVVLEGQSQGGFVSALVAAKENDIAGLILLYPALCIPDDARRGKMQTMVFDPHNIPDHIGTSPRRVSGAYPKSVINMDIFKEITGYKGPVLILHGTADPVVNDSYSVRAEKVYAENGNPVKLILVPDAGHGFHNQDFDLAVKAIEQFLDTYSL